MLEEARTGIAEGARFQCDGVDEAIKMPGVGRHRLADVVELAFVWAAGLIVRCSGLDDCAISRDGWISAGVVSVANDE